MSGSSFFREAILEKLRELQEYQFEEFVASFFKVAGFTMITPYGGVGDDGIDPSLSV